MSDYCLLLSLLLLFFLGITVHNIPEGLAVGVSFGAIGALKNLN